MTEDKKMDNKKCSPKSHLEYFMSKWNPNSPVVLVEVLCGKCGEIIAPEIHGCRRNSNDR